LGAEWGHVAVALVLAVVSVAVFLGLAHAAVHSPRTAFRRATLVMAAAAAVVAVMSPAAGAALLAPVLLSRRMAAAPMPTSVAELLDRYPARRS
jgi:ABC-type transport system involved in cytochrome c biogenesis permease subunit